MKKYLLIIFSFIILVSCTNEIVTTTESDIVVSSFTGEKVEISLDEYIYRQTIRWIGEGSDYELKVFTTNNSVIDGANSDGIINITGNLSSNHEFIYEVSSSNGILPYIISEIEIIDTETDESLLASFMDGRMIGTQLVGQLGNIDGHDIGTSIKLTVRESIENIFVEGMYAHHFMYRLVRPDYTTEWYSTFDLPDIRKIELNSQTTPALEANQPDEQTTIEAYVVTRNGFEDTDNPASVSFMVNSSYHPSSLIYCGIDEFGAYTNQHDAIMALGENNYKYARYSWDPYINPSEFVDGTTRFGTRLWKDYDGNNTVINSEDLSIFLKCGWMGEYLTNNPLGTRKEQVYDEETENNYMAEIEFIDLKLDGSIPDLNIEDSFEYEGWLRVPVTPEQRLTFELRNLAAGEHTFTQRIVDCQPMADPSPASYTFNIVDPVSAENKAGILIIDSTVHNASTTPEDIIDEFYNDIAYNHYHTSYDYDQNTFNSISPSDMQEYKLVLIHNDSHNNNRALIYQQVALNLYLQNGGNMMISKSSNWTVEQYYLEEQIYSDFYATYLGFEQSATIANRINYQGSTGTPMNGMPFFKTAVGVNDYPDINVELPGFNNLFNLFNLTGGLWNIVYFTNLADNLEEIYTFGGVTPIIDSEFYEWDDADDDDGFPSENQINQLNGKVMAYKKDFGAGKTYVLGFPLSHMYVDQARIFLDKVMLELGN